MTNSDDPRETSSGDGTANPPPDTPDAEIPTEAWQQYPDSGPLPDVGPYPGAQQYPGGQAYPGGQSPAGGPQYPGGPQFPGGQAYSGGPQYQGTQPYPEGPPYPDQPTQQFGYPQQPGLQQPNPTQALPPYDPNQHNAANEQYAATQQFGNPQYGAPQYGNPQYGSPPPPYAGDPAYATGEVPGPGPAGTGPDSSKKWIVALVALAALAVVVLAGIFVVSNQKPDPRTSASPGATRPVPTTIAPRLTLPPKQSPGAQPSMPGGLVPGGIPEFLGGTGTALGTIASIDGSTLRIDGIDGAPVTVLVTPQTQILSLSGFDISALKVGSLVVVNGSPMQEGTITADVIVETPDLGG